MLRRGGIGNLRFGNALKTVDARDFLHQVGDTNCLDADVHPVLGHNDMQSLTLYLHAEVKRSENPYDFVRMDGNTKVALDFSQRQFYYHWLDRAWILVDQFLCDVSASNFTD